MLSVYVLLGSGLLEFKEKPELKQQTDCLFGGALNPGPLS